MTDTITAPESTTEPVTAESIAAAEVERINAGGPTADGRTATLVQAEDFRHHATPTVQTLLEAVRGFGLRPKPETADQVHAALGLIAVAAVPTHEAAHTSGRWWKAYAEDSLLGHLAHRLDSRPGCAMHTPALQAAFATAAQTLTDDAFEAAPVTVRAEDHQLLLDIGSSTSLATLAEADRQRKRPRGKSEIRAAVERLAETGVVYCTKYSYRDGELRIEPTPAGAVVLKQLQDERDARIKAREAERDAAIDAILPEFSAAHTAVQTALGDLNSAWGHLQTCDDADLPAAIERLDQAQTNAADAARAWKATRDRLEGHVLARGYHWPAGGRERLATALGETGIDLDTNLTGPSHRLPKVLSALITYQNEHLTETLAARTRQAEVAAEPVPDHDRTDTRAHAAERLTRTWRLIALVAAILALAGPALIALILA